MHSHRVRVVQIVCRSHIISLKMGIERAEILGTWSAARIDWRQDSTNGKVFIDEHSLLRRDKGQPGRSKFAPPTTQHIINAKKHPIPAPTANFKHKNDQTDASQHHIKALNRLDYTVIRTLMNFGSLKTAKTEKFQPSNKNDELKIGYRSGAAKRFEPIQRFLATISTKTNGRGARELAAARSVRVRERWLQGYRQTKSEIDWQKDNRTATIYVQPNAWVFTNESETDFEIELNLNEGEKSEKKTKP